MDCELCGRVIILVCGCSLFPLTYNNPTTFNPQCVDCGYQIVTLCGCPIHICSTYGNNFPQDFGSQTTSNSQFLPEQQLIFDNTESEPDVQQLPPLDEQTSHVDGTTRKAIKLKLIYFVVKDANRIPVPRHNKENVKVILFEHSADSNQIRRLIEDEFPQLLNRNWHFFRCETSILQSGSKTHELVFANEPQSVDDLVK
ncbi:hypothetical protein C1645_826124 [Glomus cerebriforme]|uniref:Uncharacterized protein n=1 Tax=Glomus cerebriforme TaxID=658196 RepID=A0A397T0M9_9GLOM|nr:hypothetical protein C1645_826124 [Glomus cerebriforme]